MTNVRVLSPAELTPGQTAAWSAIQQADPELENPYFRPEFTAAVAAVRSDVRVAVVEHAGEAAAFFPFQLGPLGAGKPVGGRLSDYHGLVARPGLGLTADGLLKGCGLRSWAFDHLPVSQAAFAGLWEASSASRYMDLSGGFDAYLADRREAKAGDVKDVPAKIRKLERDHGPVRVDLVSDDREAFDTLLRWKSEQYRRTGLSDVFAFEWTVRLLERIWAERSEAFAGWLSTLHVADRLVAVHFGMRSFGTLHSWFPAYDLEYSKFSPGSVLLHELARAAAGQGVKTLDLGKGDEKYKLSFTNGHRLLAEGVARRGSFSRKVDSSWRSLRTWLKTGPLAAPAKASANALRPVRDRLSFR